MPDFAWIVDRRIAHTVRCSYCRADIGSPCVVTVGSKSTPLEHFPAHLVRIKLARSEDAAEQANVPEVNW